MLARSLRGVSSVLRARHQGCIAEAGWLVHAAVDDASMPDAQYPASYTTALIATQQYLNAGHIHDGFSRSHRTFFSWGGTTAPQPDAAAVPLHDAPVEDVASTPEDTLASIDPAHLVDIANMAESQALELAAESAWPNTVLAEHLITLLHTGGGLAWYVLYDGGVCSGSHGCGSSSHPHLHTGLRLLLHWHWRRD